MQNQLPHDIASMSRHFRFAGDFVAAKPFGSGHINDTFCVVCSKQRFILQRINHAVFKNPVALMENIERVTEHVQGKLPDGERRALRLVRTHAGSTLHRDAGGNYWRAYQYIDGARTYDSVSSPRQAYEAARAFGRFQCQIADLPLPRLHDTIPDFHHTPKRFAAFESALNSDVMNRAGSAKPEIEFALSHRPLAQVLEQAGLPERITHNDTKFNNVMLDDATGEAVCVIDLDTVMTGLALHDFGDMVRTTTCPALEDEQDLSKVTLQFSMFEALVRGYLSTAGEFLTSAERQHLVVSGKLITFETGLRFLTDYLCGDTYFKVHRPGHNLDRARTQFRLVESITKQQDAMERLVASV
jgi:Ser/Thr protein kinase RdoA (MazF antagonist)